VRLPFEADGCDPRRDLGETELAAQVLFDMAADNLVRQAAFMGPGSMPVDTVVREDPRIASPAGRRGA
jgi:hypothetical protein